MEPITRFAGQHDFLSNFFPVVIELDGELYPTVEHAFQAAKTADADERRRLREAPTPSQAKRLGRKVQLRTDWEQIKFEVMHGLLQQKFSRPELREKLLATGDAELIEGNKWGDRVWGCTWDGSRWVGHNWLGRLLMEVRAELKG